MSTPYGFGSGTTSGPELRIGDAERERAAAELAEHYAVGRITQEEHAERLDRIWAARTASELRPAFADLPGPAPAGPPGGAPWSTPDQRRGAQQGPRWGGRGTGRPPLPLLVLLGVLVAVAVVAHLPFVLVGLGVWFFFLRGGGCGAARARRHAWHGSHRW